MGGAVVGEAVLVGRNPSEWVIPIETSHSGAKSCNGTVRNTETVYSKKPIK
jgi:hypothetical protein